MYFKCKIFTLLSCHRYIDKLVLFLKVVSLKIYVFCYKVSTFFTVEFVFAIFFHQGNLKFEWLSSTDGIHNTIPTLYQIFTKLKQKFISCLAIDITCFVSDSRCVNLLLLLLLLLLSCCWTIYWWRAIWCGGCHKISEHFPTAILGYIVKLR